MGFAGLQNGCTLNLSWDADHALEVLSSPHVTQHFLGAPQGSQNPLVHTAAAQPQDG